jgi:hypothetical protein
MCAFPAIRLRLHQSSLSHAPGGRFERGLLCDEVPILGKTIPSAELGCFKVGWKCWAELKQVNPRTGWYSRYPMPRVRLDSWSGSDKRTRIIVPQPKDWFDGT